jgi:sialate O-acetylesterase
MSVVVSNSEIPTPVSVRYGWAANPNCNLINREGLPASPFRAPE